MSRGAPDPLQQVVTNNQVQLTHLNPPALEHNPNVVRLDQLAQDVRVAVDAIIAPLISQVNLEDRLVMNRIEDDVVPSKHRPISPCEGDFAKLSGDMPSLITIPPRLVTTLSSKDI
ncbi:hypothetical protein CDL15_Pgr010016 [Punica granatum]|uniref:Uncharacterized protein n=1 Tax=Punica granatum TaxID=22663 RepID=A0A218X5G4_PUNGR|nr:hypothetical protein CDL15_Pgr010016 [Punica granatum]